ncbi:transporter Tvp23 [Schizosaccharomyces octosporus yFS286]|uniref:Golgi apparatus membrane protein TVP23 n=1 Tax=Schizosaccharomyces octosporus (strain yFS286) TaxID=483514 RepID=S9REK9_SCHOY|nr:transporter Tvp23 [Schizosaccharomyces octosporus yFS286]EPX72509.1 transporter Tvp23 [Schizosaccharomyces octosporus yFS286]
MNSQEAPAIPDEERNAFRVPRMFQMSSHPIVLFFFLFFRTSAIVAYILGMLFTSSFMLLFILIFTLLAMDLWTVKNVSGRLLVGLRWRNETGVDGESIWIFESADPNRPRNKIDQKVFWYGLYIYPAIWCLLAILALVRFQFLWLSLVAIGVSLTSVNTAAYSRCDKDAKRRWATELVESNSSGYVSQFLSRIFVNRFFG